MVFPRSFRDYLREWGNISFDGHGYYGVTRTRDFDRAGVPNAVWFTIRKRRDVGLPPSLVICRNINDDEYLCINTTQKLNGDERAMVWWDNVDRRIAQTLSVTFIDFLREDLEELLKDRSLP